VIVRPWVAGAVYHTGDFVEDPKDGRIYRVICPEHGDELDCAVYATRLQPHNNATQFVLVARDEEESP
jgi:hypothetical protein